MKLQQWGTFSVRDHLKARAFVAEVLLYDKLVIPRPATPEEMQANRNGIVEDETSRWTRREWHPTRLRELLDVMKEEQVAIEVPWDTGAKRDWQELYQGPGASPLEPKRSAFAESIQFQVDMAKSDLPEEAAYIGTGGTLALYVAGAIQHKLASKLISLARTPGVPVEPVIAYGSYHDFTDEQGVEVVARDSSAQRQFTPYALFGWEFFVPEDSEKTDVQLLRDAVKLASRSDFREHREDFNGWLKQMYEGQVDQHDAQENALKALEEYTKIARGSGIRTAVRYAAKAATVLAPLAGLAGHGIGVGVGVLASGAALSVEWLLPKPETPDRVRQAAVLYDARRFFRKQ